MRKSYLDLVVVQAADWQLGTSSRHFCRGIYHILDPSIPNPCIFIDTDTGARIKSMKTPWRSCPNRRGMAAPMMPKQVLRPSQPGVRTLEILLCCAVEEDIAITVTLSLHQRVKT